MGCKNSAIPNDVTAIGTSAFSGQTDLTTITIPDAVTTIDGSAFYGSGLTEITIPSSVTSIGSLAFSCNNLTKVTVGMTTPPAIEEGTFSNRANATLYVHAASKAAYMEADYWKEFKRIVSIEGEPGDVNGDGVVSVEDIHYLLNIILARWNPTPNADINGDNEVNIADVTALVNIILGREEQ